MIPGARPIGVRPIQGISLFFDVDFGFLERRPCRRRLPTTPNSAAEGELP